MSLDSGPLGFPPALGAQTLGSCSCPCPWFARRRLSLGYSHHCLVGVGLWGDSSYCPGILCTGAVSSSQGLVLTHGSCPVPCPHPCLRPWCPQDIKNKRNPRLVPYNLLDERTKKTNRDSLCEAVRTLIGYGYNIEPPDQETCEPARSKGRGRTGPKRVGRGGKRRGVVVRSGLGRGGRAAGGGGGHGGLAGGG